MCRPERAFQSLGNRARRNDIGRKIGRVHIFDAREKCYVDLFRIQKRYVMRQVVGIEGRVFILPKLEWIDKNTDDTILTFLPSSTHQSGMTCMKITHCGDESHRA